jgi:tRNA-specific 2-thiouridylase
LVVGSQEQLLGRRLIAGKLSWVSKKPPSDLSRLTAKIRSRSPETPVKLSLNADTTEVEFYEPQSAIAPGQAIVFYQDEAVLGGGIIEKRLD